MGLCSDSCVWLTHCFYRAEVPCYCFPCSFLLLASFFSSKYYFQSKQLLLIPNSQGQGRHLLCITTPYIPFYDIWISSIQCAGANVSVGLHCKQVNCDDWELRKREGVEKVLIFFP